MDCNVHVRRIRRHEGIGESNMAANERIGEGSMDATMILGNIELLITKSKVIYFDFLDHR